MLVVFSECHDYINTSGHTVQVSRKQIMCVMSANITFIVDS